MPSPHPRPPTTAKHDAVASRRGVVLRGLAGASCGRIPVSNAGRMEPVANDKSRPRWAIIMTPG